MKQDLRSNCYQPLHYPTSPWKAVPHRGGSTPPTLYEQQSGFFYAPQESEQWKSCETGPTVSRPYPRRLECLTVCSCHNKDSTFSSVILRPWMLVLLGFEPANSRSVDQRLSNWANRLGPEGVRLQAKLQASFNHDLAMFIFLTEITHCRKNLFKNIEIWTNRNFKRKMLKLSIRCHSSTLLIISQKLRYCDVNLGIVT